MATSRLRLFSLLSSVLAAVGVTAHLFFSYREFSPRGQAIALGPCGNVTEPVTKEKTNEDSRFEDCAQNLVEGSEWHGNVWVPGSQRLWTSSSFRQVLLNQRVIIVGDSLARQLASSWAHFLTSTEESADLVESMAELRRGGHDSFQWESRLHNLTTKALHFHWAPVLDHLGKACSKGNFSNYDIIVFAIGLHDAIDWAGDPIKQKWRRNVNKTFACLCKLRRTPSEKPAVLVWRTAPLMDDPKKPEWTNLVNDKVRLFNQQVLQIISTACASMRIADAAAALAPRSVGTARLAGDGVNHVNYIARFVEMQFVMHAISCQGASLDRA